MTALKDSHFTETFNQIEVLCDGEAQIAVLYANS